jgi:hypothetical protein
VGRDIFAGQVQEKKLAQAPVFRPESLTEPFSGRVYGGLDRGTEAALFLESGNLFSLVRADRDMDLGENIIGGLRGSAHSGSLRICYVVIS